MPLGADARQRDRHSLVVVVVVVIVIGRRVAGSAMGNRDRWRSGFDYDDDNDYDCDHDYEMGGIEKRGRGGRNPEPRTLTAR